MPVVLATLSDYELLIGPVPTEDEAALDVYLQVASSVVYGKAPLLLGPDVQGDPTALPPVPPSIPPPATLVTCQVAANILATPTGTVGAVQAERIGLAMTQYAPGSDQDGLLPASWKAMLRPWRDEYVAVQLDTLQSDFYPAWSPIIVVGTDP